MRAGGLSLDQHRLLINSGLLRRLAAAWPKAGGHDGDAQGIAHQFVVHRTEDDVRASSAAKALTVFITSLTSFIFRLPLAAVMFTSTPLAPDRLTPSSSGEATACSAAMRARSTPAAAAGTHHGAPHFAHHGTHVFEVDVDQAPGR